MLSFGNILINAVHFLLTGNIKRGNQGIAIIISLFNSKYKCQWISVIFLQDKHSINVVSLNIKFMFTRLKTGMKERFTEH